MTPAPHDAFDANLLREHAAFVRALAQLRARLDHAAPGGRATWMAALAPLATEPAALAAASTIGVLSGVVIMKGAVKLGLAAVAAGRRTRIRCTAHSSTTRTGAGIGRNSSPAVSTISATCASSAAGSWSAR